MHEIDMQEVTQEFADCWQAAGRHLQSQVQDGISWMNASLSSPFLDHLSFRLGNQLFFVRLEPTDSSMLVPGSREGLLSIAEGCNGHPCIMQMNQRGISWAPVSSGWGLVNLISGMAVDPVALVSHENVEMTDWELHDFSVQVVRDHIMNNGGKLISSQGNPSVDPSIWFEKDEGPEWVVVRAVRYPASRAAAVDTLALIAENCAHFSKIGNFASVAVANAADAFDSSKASPMPLWRGHGMNVSFSGIERVT